MPTGQLKLEGWERLGVQFADKAVIAAIIGICRFGVQIGYEGVKQSPTIQPNLSTADADTAILTADIATELSRNRLLIYLNKEDLPQYYTASPLRLTDKADGSKRRIHHLSYPAPGTSSIKAVSQNSTALLLIAA